MIRDSYDLRSQLPQFVVESLIAAIEMMNMVDRGAAFSHQAGQNQRGAGTEVVGRDPRAAKTVGTGDDGRALVASDPGSQAI